ncbi:restriction endonuclease subunit S [Bifidobacterium avesanii]|uniref:Type I restriction modification DNA specificity domain-containing protein n=1 Tax=Bifidobacterium avesanii TaxID=1798157 RepID=A0A7K3TGJ3_9BIFI|nr:restriction endonuclease subunit S [Bifidobacterium avesanii]KAB8293650.1 restriction endonuclease subunit S [Bifidobacterium avesanii]NEG78215.1 hypothetical protein [Bifidobacterium avesanii]
MERYSAYKDSGVDWTGEIPVEWETTRLKWLGLLQKGSGIKREDILNEGKPCVRYGELYTTYDHEIKKVVSNISPELYEIQPKLCNGEVLMALTGETKEDIGRSTVNRTGSDIAFGGDTLAIKNPTCDGRFLSFAINSEYFNQQRTQGAKGDIIVHLSTQWIANCQLVIPPLHEQKVIADYLDEKTGTIDAAVRDIERSIELLNEYRQSVISEAVTKGLDPTVPIKDSGIDWIGQIPAHWELLPMKRRANFLPGYAFKSEDFNQTDGIRLLRGVNVSVGAIRWEDNVYVNSYAVNGLEEYRLSRGDILVGLDRPWIQAGMRVAQVDDESDGSYLVQRVAKVIPDEHQLSSTFLIYLFHTNIFAEAMDSTTTGVSVPHISTGQLGEVTIPCPPISEQQAISDALKKRTESINSLIQQKQSLLVRLREYRASLISECVTGKVKVPGVEE